MPLFRVFPLFRFTQNSMLPSPFSIMDSGSFANTSPIGNVVASHDSSSLPLETLRRCPLRLNDEDSAEVLQLADFGCLQNPQKTEK